MRKLILLLMVPMLIAVPVCSAVGTKISGFKDPGFADRVITKVLVQAEHDDLNYRDQVEKILVEKLKHKKINVDAVSYLELFVPTREYTPDDINQAINQNGFDSILNVKITEFVLGEPPTRSKISGPKTSGTAIINRGSPSILKCEFKLTDQATSATIWMASSNTEANGKFEHMVKYMADETMKALIKDKLIPKK